MARLAGGPSFRRCVTDLLVSGPESAVLPLVAPGSLAARALAGGGGWGLPVGLWCRWS